MWRRPIRPSPRGRSLGAAVPGLAAVLVLLLGSAILAAGGGGQTRPPRDPLAPVAATPAVVRGRVTAADTGRPLRGATVDAQPRPAGGLGATRTDPDGRYELRLPPGRYRIHVATAGYVPLEYGQRRAGEEGTPLELTPGLRVDRADVALPRGGVLTGALFDPFGDPVAGAIVRALRFRFTGGSWRLSSAGRSSETDDRGMYRLYGLAPGDYYVEAALRPTPGTGHGTAPHYAPTLYPGTSDPQGAQAVRLGLGAELSGLDFRLTTTPTARVAGRVIDPTGRPVSTVPGVSLVATGPVETRPSFGSGAVGPDGRFEISDVTPGRYTVYAAEVGVDGERRFATAEVAVTGTDVDGVLLALSAGGAARGRILFESTTPPDVDPATLTPFTMPRGDDRLPIGRGIGHVNDDWTFELRGMAGPQLVRLAGLDPTWQVRTVALAGRDITDVPIVFPARMPTTGLLVLVTNRLTTVSGTVVDRQGRVTSDYTAVVFAEDDTRWVYPSRYIRAGRGDQTGVFSLRGLPPARYLGVAAQGLSEGAWTNPEVLARLAPLAERFSLGDGERREVTLPLVSAAAATAR